MKEVFCKIRYYYNRIEKKGLIKYSTILSIESDVKVEYKATKVSAKKFSTHIIHIFDKVLISDLKLGTTSYT